MRHQRLVEDGAFEDVEKSGSEIINIWHCPNLCTNF